MTTRQGALDTAQASIVTLQTQITAGNRQLEELRVQNQALWSAGIQLEHARNAEIGQFQALYNQIRASGISMADGLMSSQLVRSMPVEMQSCIFVVVLAVSAMSGLVIFRNKFL